jgi:hypothetical protein
MAFAQSRGLTEILTYTTVSTLDPLVDLGRLDEALEIAVDIIDRLAGESTLHLMEAYAKQLRILALRGRAEMAVDWLESLESDVRHAVYAEHAVAGLASCAFARVGLGQGDLAAASLARIDIVPGGGTSLPYAPYLPGMVRTALAVGERELAERLVNGLEPRYPYAEHALVAAHALLLEDRGELHAAADAYREAAGRWERFGVVTELGCALLGSGRCVVGLGRPTEAAHLLHRAREIFERLGAEPALAEVDALLAQASERSS